MDGFLKFAYELVWQILLNIFNFFTTIGKAFFDIVTGFQDYYHITKAHLAGFNTFQWILSIILILVLIAIFALLLFKLYLILKRYVRGKIAILDHDDLMSEIALLNQQVADLVDEKSKILAMKVSQLGLKPGESNVIGEDDEEESDGMPKKKGPTEPRFPKLAQVDELFLLPQVRDWEEEITLSEIVQRYRFFAASRMKLYYNDQVIRYFIAGMATTRLIILEGISGTGKTSLPYSFSRFLNNPCGIVSVQPSYRDRTELLGYFNEFTKRFNETEFLKNLYEAGYHREPSFIVLDEMNLARIEYYFAEMLSVLEMPTADEWKVGLVPVAWENDPELLHDGKIQVPTNLWFVGTANNDDSTFTITDKVYDRAIPIDLNERTDVFEAPDTDPLDITWEQLSALFDAAREEYPIAETTLAKLQKLDQYLQTRFKLAFGNRIMKQMRDFIPVFVACGGTEMQAMDYIIQRKILKKFESLNISFVRDEIKELIAFVEKTFGKNGLVESKQYLLKLQTMF